MEKIELRTLNPTKDFRKKKKSLKFSTYKKILII